jgi:TetR/AcrR family transcriptional regulator
MLGKKSAWKQAVPSADEIHFAKRRAVLREAATSFNRNGFHATTLDEVARRLGVTKAALYHYFPNKTALLKACFDEVMVGAFANLESATRKGRNGREKLRLVFGGYLHHIIDVLSVAVVVMEDSALTEQERTEAYAVRDRFERALRDLVEEGIADGSIVPCDSKMVVLAMLGAVNWVPRWFRHDGEWSTYQLSQAMSDLLERAISPEPVAVLVRRIADITPRDVLPSTSDQVRQ